MTSWPNDYKRNGKDEMRGHQERNMMMKKDDERMKTKWNDHEKLNEKTKTDINDEYQT